MSAYVVLQVGIEDAETFESYAEAAGPTIPKFGGEVLVADDDPDALEGSWHGPRTIVLRFESKEAARAWYDSGEYQEALKLRLASATTNGVLAEGLAASA